MDVTGSCALEEQLSSYAENSYQHGLAHCNADADVRALESCVSACVPVHLLRSTVGIIP